MAYIFMSLVISRTDAKSNKNLINHIFQNLFILGEYMNDWGWLLVIRYRE